MRSPDWQVTDWPLEIERPRRVRWGVGGGGGGGGGASFISVVGHHLLSPEARERGRTERTKMSNYAADEYSNDRQLVLPSSPQPVLWREIFINFFGTQVPPVGLGGTWCGT